MHLKFRNSDLYCQLQLLLSGDITLNQGASHKCHPLHKCDPKHKCDPSHKHRGLYFPHLSVSLLLPKIDELPKLRSLLPQIDAIVTGVIESNFVLTLKI